MEDPNARRTRTSTFINGYFSFGFADPLQVPLKFLFGVPGLVLEERGGSFFYHGGGGYWADWSSGREQRFESGGVNGGCVESYRNGEYRRNGLPGLCPFYGQFILTGRSYRWDCCGWEGWYTYGRVRGDCLSNGLHCRTGRVVYGTHVTEWAKLRAGRRQDTCYAR